MVGTNGYGAGVWLAADVNAWTVLPPSTNTVLLPADGALKRVTSPTSLLNRSLPVLLSSACSFPESTSSSQTSPLAMIGGPGDEKSMDQFSVNVVSPTVSDRRRSAHGTITVIPWWARPPKTRSHTSSWCSSPPTPPNCVAFST